MDPVTRNEKAVRELIQGHASHKLSYGDIRAEAVVDPEKKHFEVIHIGWRDHLRVHGTVLHVDLIGDKIWIQYGGTSPGAAQELMEAGIPKESIVLAFHPPEVRAHTGFAVD